MLVYAHVLAWSQCNTKLGQLLKKAITMVLFFYFLFPFLKKTKAITMVITECRWIRIIISKLKNEVCLTDEIKMHGSK